VFVRIQFNALFDKQAVIKYATDTWRSTVLNTMRKTVCLVTSHWIVFVLFQFDLHTHFLCFWYSSASNFSTSL